MQLQCWTVEVRISISHAGERMERAIMERLALFLLNPQTISSWAVTRICACAQTLILVKSLSSKVLPYAVYLVPFSCSRFITHVSSSKYFDVCFRYLIIWFVQTSVKWAIHDALVDEPASYWAIGQGLNSKYSFFYAEISGLTQGLFYLLILSNIIKNRLQIAIVTLP